MNFVVPSASSSFPAKLSYSFAKSCSFSTLVCRSFTSPFTIETILFIPSLSNSDIPSASVLAPSDIVLAPSNNCLLALFNLSLDVFNVLNPVFNSFEPLASVLTPVCNLLVPWLNVDVPFFNSFEPAISSVVPSVMASNPDEISLIPLFMLDVAFVFNVFNPAFTPFLLSFIAIE